MKNGSVFQSLLLEDATFSIELVRPTSFIAPIGTMVVVEAEEDEEGEWKHCLFQSLVIHRQNQTSFLCVSI